MQLFERITVLYEAKKMTQAKFAEAIGASPSKFNQWLNAKSQKNIWEHLPTILEMFPDVRREWLFLGEGDIFANTQPEQDGQQNSAKDRMEEMQSKMDALERELAEERRLNRQLTTRLLVDGVGDKDASKNTAGKAADGQ